MSERYEFRIVEKFDVIHVYDGEHHVANCGGANEPESRSKAEKIIRLSAECAQLRARVEDYSRRLDECSRRYEKVSELLNVADLEVERLRRNKE